ncbi:MAG: FHIPEP family type III secretion protein [Phycisphaerales bacterium]
MQAANVSKPTSLQVMFFSINEALAKFSDLALAIGVAAILSTLIFRIQPWLMDILLALNISISVLVLLVALYVSDSAKLTALPTVLLMTTLFRLALNVSSTKLILLDAHAGEIIDAFGNIVVGGNFVVGGVVFVVLVIVQFLVIAKGAERVAEVGARFTLDAMPGKQMSIDADLRSQLITPEDARRRREQLERESKLYGAMDGAMKFVKGDAIAGIIISLVNIGAGLIIGIMQMDMTPGEAAKVFSLLTIGDGLVSQIPALITSVAAGLAVTRVAASSQVGDVPVAQDMIRQLMDHPRAMAVSSVLLLGLAAVDGFPWMLFLAAAAVIGAGAFVAYRSQGVGAFLNATTASAQPAKAQGYRDSVIDALPVSVVLHPSLRALLCQPSVTPESLALRPEFEQRIRDLSELLGNQFGFSLPPAIIRFEDPSKTRLRPNAYRIDIYDLPVARGELVPERLAVASTPAELAAKGIEATSFFIPWMRVESASIAASAKETALAQSFRPRTMEDVLLEHLRSTLRRNAADLFGVQETSMAIERLRRTRPELVEAVLPRGFTITEIAEILQRLLREQVPIKDLRLIFESLSRWRQKQKDIGAVTEHVRRDCRSLLCKYFTAGDTLEYYLVQGELQEVVQQWAAATPPDQPVGLPPLERLRLNSAIDRCVPMGYHRGTSPVIVVPPAIRRPLRSIIAERYPEFVVMSSEEVVVGLYPTRNLNTIRDPTPEPAAAGPKPS